MDSRSHKVDVLLDMLGKAVFLACNMCLARFGVYILVILGVQKALSFGDSNIGINPIQTLRLLNTVARNSVLSKPVQDS